MEPTMLIPLAVILVLIVGGILFNWHRKRREKHHLDEKEETIRSRHSQDDLSRKDR